MQILKPHVSLNVSNIDASVAFYEKAFGIAATKRRPGYAKFDLTEPSLNLSMTEAARTGVNASHFGIQVASTEDVIEAKGRFDAAGLPTFSEQDTACCYAVQDKVWIEDPDGNSWEVFVVKGDAPVMKADESSCCAPVGVSKQAEAMSGGCSAPVGISTQPAVTSGGCCGPKAKGLL